MMSLDPPTESRMLLVLAVLAASSDSTGSDASRDRGRDQAGRDSLADGHSTDAMASNVRDWSLYPAVILGETDEDLYVLGDVHGDYERLVTLLIAGKIIEKSPTEPELVRWTGGKAVLVAMGDYINKWSAGLKVLLLLRSLREGATAAGGRVVLLMGNHEAEFLADPEGSKSETFAAELTAAGITPKKVASGKHTLGAFLRALPFALRVRGWFFAHAGNTAGRTLTQLAADLQSGVEANGFGAQVLLGATSILEASLDPAPWWEMDGKPKKTLEQYASALSAEHLVIGHEPGKVEFSDGSKREKGELYQKYDLIFLTDLGMSRGIDYSKGALMRIRGTGTATKVASISSQGVEKTLWP